MTDYEKFLSKIVDYSSNDICWVWKGATNWYVYAGFMAEGRLWLAHRWIYKYTYGKLTKGLVIHHQCRNTLCVNPAHLEEVSRSTNNMRRFLD